MRPRATSWRSRKRKRRLHRGYRQIGQRRRHPHHRPDPADVAQRDQQRGFRLHAAKQLHHVGFAGGGEHRRARSSRSARRDAVPGRMPADGSAARHRRGPDRTDRARTRRCRAGWPWRTDDPATRRSQPTAAGSSSASQSSRRCSALLAGGDMRPAARTARPRRRNSCHLLWHIRRLGRKPVTRGGYAPELPASRSGRDANRRA